MQTLEYRIRSVGTFREFTTYIRDDENPVLCRHAGPGVTLETMIAYEVKTINEALDESPDDDIEPVDDSVIFEGNRIVAVVRQRRDCPSAPRRHAPGYPTRPDRLGYAFNRDATQPGESCRVFSRYPSASISEG